MSDTRCPCCGRDHETAHYAQPNINPRPNNPVPDELAQVRFDIKRLEEREAELKLILLRDPSTRTGAEWIAEIKTVQQTQTDWKELRANHAEIVEQYSFPREITRVVLSGVDEDTGEIISAQQKRAQEIAGQ